MLPFALLGLLASSLPALLAAAPIEHGGLQLNAQNFDSTVSKGMYLVEFYSPYCGHCRKFAPTWQSLTQTDFEDTHDRFSFAQLDCVANGDACAAQKITGYPTLWLYKDGEKVAEYTSTREIPAITQWLDERVDKRDVVVDPVVPPVQLPHDREQQKAEAIQEADKANQGTPELPKQPREDDTQPDAQRLVIQQRKASPPTANGSVIPLDKESFESLHKSDAGPLFVKFYAPWCGHCKALAPTWRDLAVAVKGDITIAEVDCEDAAKRDICRAQDIQGYPTLKFYSEGESLEYNGARALNQLEAWVRKASAAHGVRDVSPYEFGDILLSEDTFFLYLYPSSTPDSQVTMIQELTRALLGSASVYKSSASDLFHRFNLPMTGSHLLTFKAHHHQPYAAMDLSPADSKPGLMRYLKALRTPTFSELNTDTEPLYFQNPANPLVVILATNKDSEGLKRVANMRHIAESWVKDPQRRKREVVFTWVDAEQYASYMSSLYGINTTKVTHAVIIAEPSTKQYFDIDEYKKSLSIDSEQISETLEAIEQNKIKPKSSLNVFQRVGESMESNVEGLFRGIVGRPMLSLSAFVGFFAVVALIIWRSERAAAASRGDNLYIPISRHGPKAD